MKLVKSNREGTYIFKSILFVIKKCLSQKYLCWTTTQRPLNFKLMSFLSFFVFYIERIWDLTWEIRIECAVTILLVISWFKFQKLVSNFWKIDNKILRNRIPEQENPKKNCRKESNQWRYMEPSVIHIYNFIASLWKVFNLTFILLVLSVNNFYTNWRFEYNRIFKRFNLNKKFI